METVAGRAFTSKPLSETTCEKSEDLFSSSDSDGFGKDGAAESSDSDAEVETCAPYWQLKHAGRLHKTNEPRCAWQAHRVKRTLVWHTSLEDAKAEAVSLCCKCFPPGDEASQNEETSEAESSTESISRT